MAEREPLGSTESSLPWQAILYACGELDQSAEQAFDRRLGDDQAVRETLCRAVRLARQSKAGRPNPAYRAGVRARLLPAARPRGWKSAARSGRGRAILCGLAVAMAVIAASWLLPAGTPLEGASGPESSQVQAAAPSPDPDAQVALAQVALVWAEMSPSDHLVRARAEEARRRIRAEERDWLAHDGDRRARSFHGSVARPPGRDGL
jgi:anti-sigma-K factor RskA